MTEFIPDEYIAPRVKVVLKPGDVVRIDVTLADPDTGKARIWSRFACVLAAGTTSITAVNLKLHPTDKDLRVVSLVRDRVYRIHPSRWPDSVAAMRMKMIHKGVVKLDT